LVEGETHVDNPLLSELVHETLGNLYSPISQRMHISYLRSTFRDAVGWERILRGKVDGKVGGEERRTNLVGTVVSSDLLSDDEHSLVSDHLL
jgi:hypothetical protein